MTDWKTVVDNETEHPFRVIEKASCWLSDSGVTEEIPSHAWREDSPPGSPDHIYAYSLDDEKILRVHWHTCCEVHFVCITKVEILGC